MLPYHVLVVQISGMEGPGESEMEELVRWAFVRKVKKKEKVFILYQEHTIYIKGKNSPGFTTFYVINIK